jgi:RimJ/RimL family protein N-acetyltransferase
VPSDAGALARLVTDDPADYRRFFKAFPGGRTDIEAALAQADKDSYWGFFVDSELGALVMLRGLDAGFAAPAFGVYVAERYTRRGLTTAALAVAEAWCRLNNLDEFMLTVHPEHAQARRLYESEGFSAADEQSAIGYLVYRKRLRRD